MLCQEKDKTRLGRFLIVGSIGFGLDGGILTALTNGLGSDPYPARALSFAVAVTVTWALNRSWTFTGRKNTHPARQYGLYFVFQIIGALINLLVFALALEFLPLAARFPILALAAGSITALIFNYLAAKNLVFASTGEPGEASDCHCHTVPMTPPLDSVTSRGADDVN